MSDSVAKLKVTIETFFEVHDSRMFGGEGSVGYAAHKISFKGNVLKENPDYEGYIEASKRDYAKMLGVSEDCIRVITEEEYNLNTEEEEDYEEWED